MLCRNKKCNKGNFGKRAKFEQKSPSHFYCSQECLFEDMHTEAYKKKVAAEIKKDANKETKQKKIVIYEKENKKYLQNEINKLSRLIDIKFGYDSCICCGRPYGNQTDGAHYHSVGSNHTLRYCLDNIHSASSHCNDYSNTHILGYTKGLKERYGEEYQDYVVNQLPLLYPEVHLSAHDIAEKLTIVRKINRELDKMSFTDSLTARRELNHQIGIYLK